MAKAKRCWGLMVSLALTNRMMACLTESNRVRGLPLGPVAPFISTRHWGSTSRQIRISSFETREGFRLYLLLLPSPLPLPSPSIPSISLCFLIFWIFIISSYPLLYNPNFKFSSHFQLLLLFLFFFFAFILNYNHKHYI